MFVYIASAVKKKQNLQIHLTQSVMVSQFYFEPEAHLFAAWSFSCILKYLGRAKLLSQNLQTEGSWAIWRCRLSTSRVLNSCLQSSQRTVELWSRCLWLFRLVSVESTLEHESHLKSLLCVCMWTEMAFKDVSWVREDLSRAYLRSRFFSELNFLLQSRQNQSPVCDSMCRLKTLLLRTFLHERQMMSFGLSGCW